MHMSHQFTKKRSTTQVCNCRLISVTPNFAKLFEKLLRFQMMNHINKNNVLNKVRFGFQNKKSSTIEVLFFTETVKENQENSKNTAAIFLDLAKAFNSNSHKIFIKKAECFKFSEPAVNFLKSLFEEKSKCVKISTEASQLNLVNHGVPRGSVIVPLVFLSYVNDFQKKNHR